MRTEGWELGDLYRSLIVLGACGSYLTLRSSRPREAASDSDLRSVLGEYLGGRVYAPRSGRRSGLVAVSLPAAVARSLALYAQLMSELRSHVYTRLLRAGLLIYVRSAQSLVESLEAAGAGASGDENRGGR